MFLYIIKQSNVASLRAISKCGGNFGTEPYMNNSKGKSSKLEIDLKSCAYLSLSRKLGLFRTFLKSISGKTHRLRLLSSRARTAPPTRLPPRSLDLPSLHRHKEGYIHTHVCARSRRFRALEHRQREHRRAS